MLKLLFWVLKMVHASIKKLQLSFGLMFSLYSIITTLGTKLGSIFTATGSGIDLSKYRTSNQSLKLFHILNGLVQHFILGYSNSANVYVSLSQALTLILSSTWPIMNDSYNKNAWAAIANASAFFFAGQQRDFSWKLRVFQLLAAYHHQHN